MQIFIQGINASITSIQFLKLMFDNIQKICIETFLLTLLTPIETAYVYCDVTQNRKMTSANAMS